MIKAINKVLNIGNVLFLICIAVLIGFNMISMAQYIVLVLVGYCVLILTHEHARQAIAARFFLRSGCFSSSNEHYGSIHSKTVEEDIERIAAVDFPYFIRDLYIKRGYTARVIDNEAERYGADVVAEKGEEILVISAIHLPNKDDKVGNDRVQRLVASMKLYDANKAVVITNKTFTGSAANQALPNRVGLVDGQRLVDMVREVILLNNRQCRKKSKEFLGLVSHCECFGAGNKTYGILQKETLKQDIERVKPEEFEGLVKDLFKEMGYYRSYLTKKQDLGGDVIARRSKESICIQVKHRQHSEDTVDESAVEQAVAAKAVYRTKLSMVVTNGRFTDRALKLAEANDTIMIDGNKLQEMIIGHLIEDDED